MNSHEIKELRNALRKSDCPAKDALFSIGKRFKVDSKKT